MRRGEIWWGNLPGPAGRRPVLLLTRDESYPVRNQATVAVVTTRIRNNQVEVRVGPEDGLPRISVVNLDSLRTIPLQLLQERITVLSHAKMRAVEAALRFGLGMRTEA